MQGVFKPVYRHGAGYYAVGCQRHDEREAHRKYAVLPEI